MTFAHPTLLWLLPLPATLWLWSLLLRAASTAELHPRIPRATIRGRALALGRSALAARPFAALFALALLVVAIARPQGGTVAAPAIVQARDILVAVDVSRSMLAEDVPPTRLARAQLLVRNLADELRGERLGLLPFAGTAFLQSPLSADYEIFRTFLDELGPDMIPAGGSNFAALLHAADEAFGPASSAPDAAPADRFLVVLSDGEAEDDSWRPLAQKLAERGVRVISLGIGTASGAMVPDGKGGLTKDSRGAAVLSRLNPATLQELARATDGAYRDASAWVDLPALLRDTVARGHAAKSSEETAPRRRELFAWFLAPALALLALSLVREFPVFPRLSNKPRRSSAPAVARALPMLLALACTCALTSRASAADPAASPADPLVSLVEKLAASPALSAPDLAQLATATADKGEQARSGGAATSAPPIPEGAVRDALAAVSLGEKTDARAADWPGLRKRLNTLLAPPPEQPSQKPQKPQDQQKQDDQKSSPQQKSPSSDNSKNSPPPESKDPSQQNSSDAKQTSPDAKDSSGSQGSSGNSSPSSSKPDEKPGSSPQSAGKPLGDLSDSSKPSEPAPAPSEKPSADEPTQQAGGVSSSGRPADASASAQPGDAALAVPQQRLERVRDADAPARLFQLLQDAETPPDARQRRAAGAKQDW